MTDLRARLADALREQFCIRCGHCHAGLNCSGRSHPKLAEYLADVVMSLPGIAIVELPDAGTVWLDDYGWIKSPELHAKLSAMWRRAAANNCRNEREE